MTLPLSTIECATQIRELRLNRFVEFMFLGDPIKALILPHWTQQEQELPSVYRSVYSHRDGKVYCNIWDWNTDNNRLFPLDDTEETGFDYCIIVYDAITRKTDGHISPYLSAKEQVVSRQHSERKCSTIVIVLRTPWTKEDQYMDVKAYCLQHQIHCIYVDNTKEGISRVSNLPERLCSHVMTEREGKIHRRVRALLDRREPALTP